MNNNCKICSRKLDGTRSVSCSTTLKHTNCPIYEVVEQVIPQKFAQHPYFTDKNSKKLLFINENVIDKTENSEYNKEWQDLVKVLKLCFRCYRVLLGIDYHGFELKRLKGQIIKLSEDSKEENEMDAKKDGLPIQSVIDSGNNIETKIDLTNMQVIESIDPTDIELIVDENMSINKEWTNNEDNVKIHPILDLANPVFKAGEIDADNDNTKRNRRCTRLLDYEYLEINEKYIKKKSLNEKSENNYKEIKIEKYTKTKKKGPILCRNCHKKFKTKKSLNTHKCHQGRPSIKNNAYSCKVCGINMNCKQSYIEHVESCYKNIVVQCDYCPVKLPSAAFLPRHMEAYHEGQPVISKEVLCDQCGREFARKESLDRHQATVHGVSYGQHQCSQCKRRFLRKNQISQYLWNQNANIFTQCACAHTKHTYLQDYVFPIQHGKKKLYICMPDSKLQGFHKDSLYQDSMVHGVNRHRCSRCCQHFSSEAEFVLHKNNCHKIDSKVKNKQSKSRSSSVLPDHLAHPLFYQLQLTLLSLQPLLSVP
ncbi:unnamed protein product [Meganyctiphanes norvegica]|uniref:C2H2-type domain-containing protein n=1 Tax=Meganyctiphanes norvegica TaxID=48144 RepID=A0AAV2RBC8_MEGNR